MTPTRVALAPRMARYGPLMLRAPSYTKSANRLTTPIRSTKRNARLLRCCGNVQIYRAGVIYGDRQVVEHTISMWTAAFRILACHSSWELTVAVRRLGASLVMSHLSL